MSGDFDEAADTAKYEAMRSELVAEGRLEPRESQVAEEASVVQPQHHQEQHREHYEPQEHQQGIPHPYEDPIQHFSQRASNVENHLQQRALVDAIAADEAAAVAEMPDYYDACAHLESARMRELEKQIPDGVQGDLYAHRHGLGNAAEARAAHLNMDRQQVVAWAMQNNMTPAGAYYYLAWQKGYQPTTVPRSLIQQVQQAKGADYDKAWSAFEKASRRADENFRNRR